MLKQVVVLLLVLLCSPFAAQAQNHLFDHRDEIFNGQSFEPHQITILNEGLASLQKRIEIIEKAKHSIEVEYCNAKKIKISKNGYFY